jgi:glycosyltransferase involved in cell wall biosynthesis
MRIVHLTAGTGAYYCGSCMRDHDLVAGLKRLGHDVLIVPMYLPPVLEEGVGDESSCPIFFGGINVYLQQKSWVFRHTPAWLDRLFDGRGLLRWASGKMHMTSPRDLGEILLSMLAGDDGNQRKEVRKLARYLAERGPWDVISISNAMLMGVAPHLRLALQAKAVICTLQGEDSFLDSLQEPWRTQAWATLERALVGADLLVPVSRYYGEVMAKRLPSLAAKMEVVHNGIDLSGYGLADVPPAAPTLGYLARLHPLKGLGVLVDAFIALATRPHLKDLLLRVAGSATAEDEKYVDTLRTKLSAAGLEGRAEFRSNLSKAEKQEFLRSLSVLSVPATYGEAFGLYVIEALASGVPVVQPKSGAFPELIEATTGGIISEGDDALSLADAIDRLLSDPIHARVMGGHGRKAVLDRFSADAMAERFAALCAREMLKKGPIVGKAS